MQKNLTARGALWFSTVDEQGIWLEQPARNQSPITRLLEHWNVTGRKEPTTYRVQTLATRYGMLAPVEQEMVRQLFLEARPLLWQQLEKQMKRP